MTVIRLFYKELLFYAVDPVGAQAAGLPIDHLHMGLMILVALTVVTSMKAVGVILVIALLIAPSATAYLMVPKLHHIMGVATTIGSYYWNIPSGPAIILLIAFGFVLVILNRGRYRAA